MADENKYVPITDLETETISLDTSGLTYWIDGSTALSAENLNKYTTFIKDLVNGINDNFDGYTAKINERFDYLDIYLGSENNRLTNLKNRFDEYDRSGFPANSAETYAVIVYRTGSSSTNTGIEGNGLFIINSNNNLDSKVNVDMIGYDEDAYVPSKTNN